MHHSSPHAYCANPDESTGYLRGGFLPLATSTNHEKRGKAKEACAGKKREKTFCLTPTFFFCADAATGESETQDQQEPTQERKREKMFIRAVFHLLLAVASCHAFVPLHANRAGLFGIQSSTVVDSASCLGSAVADAPAESSTQTEQKIRNVAVIAHVDHGKTTL